jgi:protein ImuB
MFFTAIYVPDFLVEAVVRAEPRLYGSKVAIVDGTPPLVKVVAANSKARAAGIEAGMSKLEAEAMPGLALRLRSPALEAAAHRALLECAQAFSPRVEEAAADTLLLDLAGLEPLFGPPQKMAHELARRARELGLEARVAVASNPDAAVHAARGFPGITFIPAGREAERLGPLPLEALFPDPRAQAAQQLLETFDRWGVRTFRALAALPSVALAERLGPEGLRLQRLARGAAARPLVPVEEPLEFEESVELEHPVVLLEPLAFLLNRMLERLCARLAARALAIQELRLRLQLEGAAAAHQRSLHFPLPTTDSKTLLKLLQLDLEAHPPGAPVVKITLAVAPAKPRPPQGGLFAPLSPPPEKLELTLARLAGVVGEEQVGSAELMDTHRPDAFRTVKFGGVTAQGAIQNARLKMQNAKKLAFRRFRPPRRAQVETRAGRPAEVHFGSLRGRVVDLAGPWRTSGEWWTGEGWARDEWDVVLEEKGGVTLYRVALYRIYRDLESGAWFVEGSYD